jgi:hypothetical protein
MKGPHTGENLFCTLREVIEELELQNKVGYFMLDNASSNTKTLHFQEDELAERQESQPSANWATQGSRRRLRCFGHILNIRRDS